MAYFTTYDWTPHNFTAFFRARHLRSAYSDIIYWSRLWTLAKSLNQTATGQSVVCRGEEQLIVKSLGVLFRESCASNSSVCARHGNLASHKRYDSRPGWIIPTTNLRSCFFSQFHQTIATPSRSQSIDHWNLSALFIELRNIEQRPNLTHIW